MPALLIVLVAGGVFREPAAKDSLFLHEHLADTPEAAEGKTADDDGKKVIRNDQ